MSRTSLLPYAKRHLTETASIVRPVRTPNGRGGWTSERAVIWTGKCSVRFPAVPREGVNVQDVIDSGRAIADFAFDGSDLPELTMADVILWDDEEWEIQGYNHQATHRVTLRVLAWRTLT